ncbi:MAG: LolA family protein [Solirubrobacteraceae bacterium]
MKFLRTVSTRRLLALLTGLVLCVGGGTAIAAAASGSGPVPPAKPLANAVHDALAAPQVAGITARISFTNHLIDASNIQGSDPLLTGSTGRLWLSSDHRLRLELQAANGDAQIVVANGSFSAYDPSSNTAYQGALPAHTGKPDRTGAGKEPAGHGGIPTVAQIQTDLGKLMAHVDVSGATPSDVAGQAAYTVRVSPKHDGGLLGAGELAVDAARGVPLRVAVYARGASVPVLELKATDISYGAVPASTFAISPPSGAKIVRVATPAGHGATAAGGHGARSGRHGRGHQPEISGVAAVAAHLPFTLRAPSTLVGLPRRSVTRLDWGGHPAALIAYGQNLGGVAVIEQTADASGKSSSSPKGDHHRGLNLPTVSINGVTGQELDTVLGTVVRFTRGAVAYTVIGSVPAVAADAAARAL